MAKKRKTEEDNDLWVAPRYSLKEPNAGRAYENASGGVPTSNRFLELADIALGLKKPDKSVKRKKAAAAAAASAHNTSKKEPHQH